MILTSIFNEPIALRYLFGSCRNLLLSVIAYWLVISTGVLTVVQST